MSDVDGHPTIGLRLDTLPNDVGRSIPWHLTTINPQAPTTLSSRKSQLVYSTFVPASAHKRRRSTMTISLRHTKRSNERIT